MKALLKSCLGVALLAAGVAPVAVLAQASQAGQSGMSGSTSQPSSAQMQAQGTATESNDPAVATPAPATADSPVSPAMPSDPNYHGGAYAGALAAPPAQTMNKQYPVCSASIQDECRNRRGW